MRVREYRTGKTRVFKRLFEGAASFKKELFFEGVAVKIPACISGRNVVFLLKNDLTF
jgi:hypothetical protein